MSQASHATVRSRVRVWNLLSVCRGSRRFYSEDPHGNRLEFPGPIEPELMVTGRSEYLRSEIENLGHDPVRCGDRSLRRPPDGLVPARKDQTYARYIPYISVLC
jgi:hypothetical protein